MSVNPSFSRRCRATNRGAVRGRAASSGCSPGPNHVLRWNDWIFVGTRGEKCSTPYRWRLRTDACFSPLFAYLHKLCRTSARTQTALSRARREPPRPPGVCGRKGYRPSHPPTRRHDRLSSLIRSATTVSSPGTRLQGVEEEVAVLDQIIANLDRGRSAGQTIRQFPGEELGRLRHHSHLQTVDGVSRPVPMYFQLKARNGL